VTDINCDVPARVETATVCHARPGASGLRSAFPGTGMSGAVVAARPVLAGPAGLVRPVTHVRIKAAAVSLASLMAQDGQTNNYIQMTSVFVSGEGASGPPPDREPA
jgi:hypothetical protein